MSIILFSSVNESPNKYLCADVCAQSCPTLCDPMDCSPPGSSIHGIFPLSMGIFQARILEGLPFPPLGDLSDIGIERSSLVSPAVASRFFTTAPPGKLINALPECVCAQSLSCVTVCDSMDCNHQAPFSMGFARQEYWSRLPLPSPGHLPNPGIKHMSPGSPAVAGRFFTMEPILCQN